MTIGERGTGQTERVHLALGKKGGLVKHTEMPIKG
jgi:hypothetical protein